jgi:hypothetical protein
MSRSHARKKTGRSMGSKATPGQAKRSPRKRFLRLRNTLAQENYNQEEQDKYDCHIVIQGHNHWSDIFKGKSVTFGEKPSDPIWIKYCGAKTVPYIDYMRVEADLNKVSFERTILSKLISAGYELDALEVNFDDGEQLKWGRCVWLKEHESYKHPSENLQKMFPTATEKDFAIISAMFKTQYAGEQSFGLCSMQMLGAALVGKKSGFLFHKRLIFRKVILSAPKPQAKAGQPVAQAA